MTFDYRYGESFPGSTKVYLTGDRDDIRVPFRAVALSASPGPHGGMENPPLRVYDTTGPYTDPDHKVDLKTGLPSLRGEWITQREDVESYDGIPMPPQPEGSTFAGARRCVRARVYKY